MFVIVSITSLFVTSWNFRSWWCRRRWRWRWRRNDCFELANIVLWAVTIQIIPFFAVMLHSAIFISWIVGLSTIPWWVWDTCFKWSLPSSLTPLISDTNPTIFHESMNNISCLLIPYDRKVSTFTFTGPLSIVPIFLVSVIFVVVPIPSFLVTIWNFWSWRLRWRRRWSCFTVRFWFWRRFWFGFWF